MLLSGVYNSVQVAVTNTWRLISFVSCPAAPLQPLVKPCLFQAPAVPRGFDSRHIDFWTVVKPIWQLLEISSRKWICVITYLYWPSVKYCSQMFIRIEQNKGEMYPLVGLTKELYRTGEIVVARAFPLIRNIWLLLILQQKKQTRTHHLDK